MRDENLEDHERVLNFPGVTLWMLSSLLTSYCWLGLQLLLLRLRKAAMAGWIQSGEVRARRSPWRLSILPDTFFALVNMILSFFQTMFSLDAHQNYGKRSDHRRPGSYGGSGGFGPGGPGGPGGPSGGYGRGPPRGMDSVRGIDHSAPTPCGSCCAG